MALGSRATFSAKTRRSARTALSWARVWLAESATLLKLSCSSAWVSSFWSVPSVFRPPRPSRSLLVRSSRSAARTLIRRTAWPMSVDGRVVDRRAQVFEDRVELGEPGVEPGRRRGEPVEARLERGLGRPGRGSC